MRKTIEILDIELAATIRDVLNIEPIIRYNKRFEPKFIFPDTDHVQCVISTYFSCPNGISEEELLRRIRGEEDE